MKKLLSIVLALVMALSLCVTTWAADTVTMNGTGYADLATALNAAAAMTTEDVTVEILADIALTDWTSVNVGRTHSDGLKVVINGNNHKITGLTKPLFGVLLVVSNFEINDLTISGSTIGNVATTDGKDFAAAFIGYAEACVEVTLNNCHLTGSTVKDANWNGGLIGYAAGYDDTTNGAVFETVTFNNCSVTDSTISGPGSAGGLMGHAAGNPWTKIVVNNATVSGNTIRCTDGDNKAGALFGTASSANGVELEVSATVSGNTGYSGSATTDGDIPSVFGRIVDDSNTTTLTVKSGIYDSDPTVCGQGYAVYAANTPVATDENGNYYVGSDLIVAAVKDDKVLEVMVGGAIEGLPYGIIVEEEPEEYALFVNDEAGDETTLNGTPAPGGSYYVLTDPPAEPAHSHTRRQPTTTVVTPDTTTTDTVTSAKTFDAGIAVYAAMGVLSLTGSAWIVGKKRG